MGLEDAVDQDKNGKPARATRSAILLAAAPHLMYGLLTILGELGFLRGANWFGFIMFGALIALILLAWRKRWPLWSATWAGFVLVYTFFTASIALGSLFGTLRLDYGALALVPLILLGGYMFQRRPLYGLLASLPFLVFMDRFFAFELVLGGAWVFAGMWLLAAFLSGAIIRLRTVRHGVLLTVGFHLVTGVAFSLGRGYLPLRFSEVGRRAASTWQGVVNDFLPLTLALIALTLAFLLLHPLSRLAIALEADGRRNHLLLLGGLVAAFGGRFGLIAQGAAGGVATVIAAVVLGVGLALSLAAAFLLARAARRTIERPTRALVVPFLVALAPLVVFSLATPFAPDGSYSADFQRVLILSYAGVLLWVGVALWVLLHHNQDIRLLPQSSTGPRNPWRNRMSQTRWV